MKLYSSMGPNPRAARMALAEKGLAYERVEIDIMRNESRTSEYIGRVNPSGTVPALETDEGVIVCEIGAIAEYLDEIAPDRPLIGSTVAERAETRMWARRLDLEICVPMGLAFQAGPVRPFFEGKKKLAPADSVPSFIDMAHTRFEWLEGQMAGRDWICGDRFSWADVPTFCYLEFFQKRGKQQTAPTGGWLDGWRERMRARPSASA